MIKKGTKKIEGKRIGGIVSDAELARINVIRERTRWSQIDVIKICIEHCFPGTFPDVEYQANMLREKEKEK